MVLSSKAVLLYSTECVTDWWQEDWFIILCKKEWIVNLAWAD